MRRPDEPLPSDAAAARILTLQVGRPRELGRPGAEEPVDRPWSSGIFKDSVEGPLRLDLTNLEGDGQADRKHHGGPDKAVCVYPAAHYPFWRRELGLADLPAGAFGENFTVRGLTEESVCVGDVYAVGSAVVQVSQPRQPCWKLARRWRVDDLAARVQRTGYTGWYFRVLREGEVAAGMPLRLLERAHGEWTIARANETMHHHRDDWEAARALAACPPLSASWRETLQKRAQTGENPDPEARLRGAPAP